MYIESINEYVIFDKGLVDKIVKKYPRSILQITCDDGEQIYHDPDVTSLSYDDVGLYVEHRTLHNDFSRSCNLDDIDKIVVVEETACSAIDDLIVEYVKEQEE